MLRLLLETAVGIVVTAGLAYLRYRTVFTEHAEDREMSMRHTCRGIEWTLSWALLASCSLALVMLMGRLTLTNLTLTQQIRHGVFFTAVLGALVLHVKVHALLRANRAEAAWQREQRQLMDGPRR